MRVLIVAATEPEIAGISDLGISISDLGEGEGISELGISISDLKEGEGNAHLGMGKNADRSDSGLPTPDFRLPSPDSRLPTSDSKLPTPDPKLTIKTLITGVGMTATAFALGCHLATNQYDLVINLGIAGSFDQSIALGDVVEITEDRIAELGAEDDETFIPIEELGFGESCFSRVNYPGLSTGLKSVTAITVNTVHGNEATIGKVTARLQPQLESMEGAAFFYACQQFELPCIQIRAVSNYVEKRNRDGWKIGLAVKNLNNFAAEFLSRLAAV